MTDLMVLGISLRTIPGRNARGFKLTASKIYLALMPCRNMLLICLAVSSIS